MVFTDASHAYEDVKEDIAWASPHRLIGRVNLLLCLHYGCMNFFHLLQQFLFADDVLSVEQIDQRFRMNHLEHEELFEGHEFSRIEHIIHHMTSHSIAV